MIGCLFVAAAIGISIFLARIAATRYLIIYVVAGSVVLGSSILFATLSDRVETQTAIRSARCRNRRLSSANRNRRDLCIFNFKTSPRTTPLVPARTTEVHSIRLAFSSVGGDCYRMAIYSVQPCRSSQRAGSHHWNSTARLLTTHSPRSSTSRSSSR